MRRMHKPVSILRHATALFAAVTAFTCAALAVGAVMSHVALLAVDAANPAATKPAKPALTQAKLPAPGAGNVANGMKLFRQNNCSMCHPGGENNLNPLKPLKGPGFLKKYPTDAAVCQQVRKGSVGTGMPPFPKSQITDGELRDIIAYIRSLTPSTSPPAPATKKAPKKPA